MSEANKTRISRKDLVVCVFDCVGLPLGALVLMLLLVSSDITNIPPVLRLLGGIVCAVLVVGGIGADLLLKEEMGPAEN